MQDAVDNCVRKINERNLHMNIVKAEYTFDASKIIFFFLADGRVDFRNLVKDLAKVFRVRIELKQIGVRDKAKITSGYAARYARLVTSGSTGAVLRDDACNRQAD